MAEKQKNKATVFIPTWFGEDYLEPLLTSVFNQKVDFEFDVMITDTSSTDRTIEIIESFQKEHKNLTFKSITKEEFGHGRTRNQAAQEAKGEIMVYLSQDAIPSHDRWLYEMVRPFDINPKLVGVTGKQIPRAKCVPMLKNEIRSVFANLGPDFGLTLFYKDTFMENPIFDDAVAFYSDVNSAARRSFLVGEIPYRDVPYSEDQLFGKDLIDAGMLKAYTPRGSVIHSNDLLLSEYKLRIFDEYVGLRKIGKTIPTPTIRASIKATVVGSVKDAYMTLHDHEYSTKRKLYWLVMNPFYYVEKFRGIRLASRIDLNDEEIFAKNSLESNRNK